MGTSDEDARGEARPVTPVTPRRGRETLARSLPVVGAAVAVVLVWASIAQRGALNYTTGGFTYPGGATATATALVRLLADAAGAVTLGTLVYAALCTPARAGGRIGVATYAALRLAVVAAPVWLAAALAETGLAAANVTGQSFARLVASGHLWTVIGQTLPSRAWLVTTVCVVPLVLAVRSVLTWTGVAGAAVWAALALLPPVVVGNAGEGLGHDVDTDAAIVHLLAAAIWLGVTVAALAGLRRVGVDRVSGVGGVGGVDGAGSPGGPGGAKAAGSPGGADSVAAVTRRVTAVTLCCAVGLAISGATLAPNLVGTAAWTTTQYGVLATAKVLVLIVVVGGALVVSRRLSVWITGGSPARAAMVFGGQAGALLVAVGASVAMAQQPAAAFFTTDPTPSEQNLGYALTRPAGFATLATMWRFDLVLGSAAVLLAAAYLYGVRRLRRSGAAWSAGRTASFLAGCAALVVLSSSGVAAYAEATYSMHMVQHMGINMVVPLLLVLGAPRTLLDAVCDRAPAGSLPRLRDLSDRLVDSRPVRVLTNPFGAVVIFVALLFGIYLTPIFGYAIGFHWGHELMSIAFLISGYFLFWQIVGTDRLPRETSFLTRLGLLIALMPVHALFGVAVFTHASLLGLVFYGNLDLPWLAAGLADQRLGALIVWIGGELPLVAAALVVMTRWWSTEGGAPGRGPDSMAALQAEFRAVRGRN